MLSMQREENGAVSYGQFNTKKARCDKHFVLGCRVHSPVCIPCVDISELRGMDTAEFGIIDALWLCWDDSYSNLRQRTNNVWRARSLVYCISANLLLKYYVLSAEHNLLQ